MKKRLRKKLRLGEFREDGFKLSATFDPDRLDWEAFYDRLFDAFSADGRDLAFTGGGRPESWSVVVGRLGRGTVTEAERAAVLDWTRRQPEVRSAEAGPLRDLWHDGSW